MRTTIRLPDDLYDQVRQRALEHSTTVTSVIENALRTTLAAPDRPGEAFVVEPFAGDGLLRGVDLTDSAAMLETMEG